MSLEYKAVQWNRQKRIYDFVLIGGVALYLLTFGALTEYLFPFVTDEILLMRAFGTAAFLLLHAILCIGPLCRLNPRFLPLLYNRRHAGVTLFLLALIHGVLVVATYHAGGDTNPILSIFVSSPLTNSVAGVPFQPFGFFALVILFLMAATSHDFWLANLSAPVWKSLHMLVYAAYALLALHVAFGVLQAETSPVYAGAMALGLATVLTLHLLAAQKETRLDRESDRGSRREEAQAVGSERGCAEGQPQLPATFENAAAGAPAPCTRPRSGLEALGLNSGLEPSLVTPAATDTFVNVCAVAEIPENRARIVCLSGERVAIFKYAGRISAVSNVCQHQNGPLGEGKIVDGCITCPWHGYQYLPETGASPPPFVEKVPTFNVRVANGRVWVDPVPNPAGIKTEPAIIET